MVGSLFADDAVAAADATAVASDDAAAAAAAVAVVAVAPAAGTDTGTDIGIGTAATGTGIDIGDWAGVFGAVLPGPAVPYRWDDMYHQKPGLAVCLYVVFNHSFRHSHRHIIRGGRARQSINSLPLVFLLCVWTHRMFLWYFSIRAVILIRVYSSRADWHRDRLSSGRSSGQKKKKGNKCFARRRDRVWDTELSEKKEKKIKRERERETRRSRVKRRIEF